jgi:hypothetical protein
MRFPSCLAAPLAVLVLTAPLAGCSAFGGDDYDDLAPGRFRLTADGRTYSGTALYYPNTDRPLADAAVFLTEEDRTVMSFRADALLNVSAGDRVVTLASFHSPSALLYQSREGEIRNTSVELGRIEGQFRLRLEENAIGGPFDAGDITAEGGFHATLADE